MSARYQQAPSSAQGTIPPSKRIRRLKVAPKSFKRFDIRSPLSLSIMACPRFHFIGRKLLMIDDEVVLFLRPEHSSQCGCDSATPVFANVPHCVFIQSCWNASQRLFVVAGLIGPAPRLSQWACIMNNLCISLGTL